MGLAGHLYHDSRWAERHPVERDATLRDPAWLPVDVQIEDLSEGGFRVMADADLAIGDEIGLGLAGLGTRQARIVRRTGNLYGCEFLAALARDELDAALAATPIAPIALPLGAPDFEPLDLEAFALEADATERLSAPLRLFAIALGVAVSWPTAVALIRLARQVLI